MAPNLDVPETDPRHGAGERICEHIDDVGDALTEDEKDGLAHIIAGHIAAGTLESLGDFRTHHLVVAGLDRAEELQLTAPPPQNFVQTVEYRHAAEALVRVLRWGRRDYEASLMSCYERDAVQRMGSPPVSRGPCGGGGVDHRQKQVSTAFAQYVETGNKFRMGATRPVSFTNFVKWGEGVDYSWENMFYVTLSVGAFYNTPAWKKFSQNTARVVALQNKWMEDDFFKVNGFRKALERRISDLETEKAGGVAPYRRVVRMKEKASGGRSVLKALKGSVWLK